MRKGYCVHRDHEKFEQETRLELFLVERRSADAQLELETRPSEQVCPQSGIHDGQA